MLMIRLQRIGRVHEPVFRVVLTDSKNSTKSGKYLEVLGNHDTRKDKNASAFDIEKIKYWMSKGAKLSPTMNNILVSRKLIVGKKMNKLPKNTPKVEEPVVKKEEVKAEAPAEAAPAEVAA